MPSPPAIVAVVPEERRWQRSPSPVRTARSSASVQRHRPARLVTAPVGATHDRAVRVTWMVPVHRTRHHRAAVERLI